MNSEIKNICCIGAGYVGGPTMAVIADQCPQIQVNVVDINELRINAWNNFDTSLIPIYEPGLPEIIERCRGINLHFSVEIERNISNADMIFISVNTPTKTKGIGAGQASDLKWVESSARQIAKYAKDFTIVVEKSTLPVKTAQVIKQILELSNRNSAIKKFSVLSNPEFLSEGNAINDLENPDRVLIGGDDKNSIKQLEDIYLNWVSKDKIITTNLWSSELSKLISNAFLAQRISSINSITALCESTGADIREVSKAITTDKRIGKYFLNPGPGFGGSCFKKDILNLVYICNHYGLYEVSNYWEKVISINDWQSKRILNIIVEKLFGTVSDKKITILGFSFKANTNDTRESPAIRICNGLLEEGACLQIYDPQVSEIQIKKDLGENSKKLEDRNFLGNWEFSKNMYSAAEGTDAVIIITEWDEFKNLDWERLSKLMRSPAWVFDTRSISNLDEANSYGINVWRIGTDNSLLNNF